ncbi:MAG TPA: response regulator [Verrucomicrobiae bacterium]|nr:response regulator [Verrucomicrobiae bacterium]
MNSNKRTILFVEDNQLVFSIYLTWLRRFGFRVEGASDGEIAVQKLPIFRPDLVILDYMMPKLNGQEVLKFIRSQPDMEKTPVLVLSNAFLGEETLKLLNDGASRQIFKTHCTPKILVQTIRELLGLVPPPDWESGAFPPPNKEDEPAEEKPLIGTDGRANRNYFTRIREASLAFAKEADSPNGNERLKDLYQHVQSVTARAGLEGSADIANLAGALEALLSEVGLKRLPPPPSVLHTITQAVDCLGSLFDKGRSNSSTAHRPTKALIVEDNPICNMAAMTAMKRAKFEATSTRDPNNALEMARLRSFDVFLLDVNLPGMNGFELCKELRLMPHYKKTPVIFVTSSTDFQKRSQAVLSGGNDLIAKPVWPQELAVKTIIRLAQSSETPGKKAPVGKTVRPQTPPASSKAAEKDRLQTNGKDVMAGNEPSGTAPNGDAIKARRDRNHFKPSPDCHSPGDNSLDWPTREITRIEARIKASPVDRAIPAGCGGNQTKSANPRDKDKPFDRIIQEITSILFGEDKTTGMSLHLTRIALENYRVPEIINHTLDENGHTNGGPVVGDFDDLLNRIAREVARVIYDTEEVSERHLRLTRIALERHRVQEIINPNSASNDQLNGTKPATDDLECIRKDINDIKSSLTSAQNPPQSPALNGSEGGTGQH